MHPVVDWWWNVAACLSCGGVLAFGLSFFLFPIPSVSLSNVYVEQSARFMIFVEIVCCGRRLGRGLEKSECVSGSIPILREPVEVNGVGRADQ